MLSNRFGFAALAIACVTAAGVGGYIASRQNIATPAPVAAAVPPAPAVQPVQETEAVVGDTSPRTAPAAPALAPAPRAASSPLTVGRRAETAPSRPGKLSRRPDNSVAQSTPPPTLERNWPSAAAAQPAEAPASPSPAEAPAPRQEDVRAAETPRTAEPPTSTFVDLVVPADSVVGLQMETLVSSERAHVEDRVEARVVRDVRVAGQVAISAGSRALGTVMVVERGGKFKERARLGIRFHTLVMADDTRLPVTTETIYRYGEAPGNGSAAKVGGGAVAGAILGAILGGAKGAAIGATSGAGAGTAAVMAGDRNEASFPVGSEVTARFSSPVTVTLEK